MTRRERARKRRHAKWALVALVFLLALAAWYVLTQTAFAFTHKVVPPKPTTADCTQVEQEIAKYDWDRDLALAVAKAESSCEPEAKGDTDIVFDNCSPDFVEGSAECEASHRQYGYSVGVFQIRILPGREHCDTFDVATNVACAYEVYLEDGRSFEPWSGYTSGKYKDYYWRTLAEFWPF